MSLKPLPLEHRFRIGLPVPMGAVNDIASVERALAYLHALGHTTVLDPHWQSRRGYFAATDFERFEVLQGMLDDPAIDLVMPIRGGYGMTRLLPQLDFTNAKMQGKRLIGFSDFTALQMKALRDGLVTFAGPMAGSDFGSEQPDPWAREQCWSTLARLRCQIDVADAHTYPDQTLEGVLWGTNLSLVSHLVGTPFLPVIEGGVLLVEEVDEEPYAVERMLMQLWHAGILASQKALIIGSIRHDTASQAAKVYPPEAMIADLRRWLPIPVLAGFPFGHVAHKATLPIGGRATLSIQQGGYRLTVDANASST